MKTEQDRKPTFLYSHVVLGCILSAALLLPVVANAQPIGSTLGGQPLFGVFYENGTGYLNGVLQQAFADPVTGAPTWILPYSVVAGDVLSPDGVGNPVISDVLRFPNVAGGVSDRVMLFSDVGGGEMADVGIPAVFQPNTVTIPEINGFIDYDVPGGIDDYHVFSSEIPEPSSLVLGFLSLGSLIALRRQSRG